MSDSITTRIEVAVTPDVAFDVFTGEIDAWYRVDTHTLPDITRTAQIRFEPELGGRLLDVHDPATGDGREMGRITRWEPGRGLTFTDNEGTEVDVRFEPVGAGTRLTLTHRGLDRLAPERAKELRRFGWAALTPFYRDHIAPNARPLALAVAFQGLLLLAIVGAMGLTLTLADDRPPAWVTASVMSAVLLVAGFAVLRTQDRVVRRWLPSPWRFQRISFRLFGLLCLAFLIANIYGVVAHGEDLLGALVTPIVALLACWSWVEEGPARGRSLRATAGPQTASWRPRTTNQWVLWIAVLGAIMGAVLAALGSVDMLSGALSPILLTAWGGLALHAVVSKRREKRSFGFHPDLYLAVARPVSDGDDPPALLVHRPSPQPEYSGWYAYPREWDERCGDLVAWSMKDLVDHSPQTAGPLRAGHGEWRWDHERRAYTRVEPPGDRSRR